MANNFSQEVQDATHEKGGLIDHVYVRLPSDCKNTVNVAQRAKYYSDHDALFLKIN